MKILIQKLGLLFHLCYFCDILLLKYILCKYLEVVNTIKNKTNMSTFRSIEELVKSLDREKELLKEMFAKRKSLSFRYDFALEMTEYKEERIPDNPIVNQITDTLFWKWKKSI